MAQWDFRYEDLRPQTLQDYYESSLGAAVQLSFNARTKDFEIAVGQSKRQRKELRAYYTDPRLCRFMVERTVKPLFEERHGRLRQAIARKDQAAAQTALDAILGMSICDPTMGSAPSLRSAFDYLSEQYLPLCRDIADAKAKAPGFTMRLRAPPLSLPPGAAGWTTRDGAASSGTSSGACSTA